MREYAWRCFVVSPGVMVPSVICLSLSCASANKYAEPPRSEITPFDKGSGTFKLYSFCTNASYLVSIIYLHKIKNPRPKFFILLRSNGSQHLFQHEKRVGPYSPRFTAKFDVLFPVFER